MVGKKVRHSPRKPTPLFIVVLMIWIFSAIFGWCIGLFIYGPSPALAEEGLLYICTTQKGTWVNVRATPEATGRIVGTMRYGYEIEPLGETNGYFIIPFNDAEAYVRKEFFETPYKARGTVNSRVVYRNRPNGKKLGHLNPGSWIDILAKTVDADGTDWYRCYGNVYIMSKYLEVAK